MRPTVFFFFSFVSISLFSLSCTHTLRQSPDCMSRFSPERFKTLADRMRTDEEIDSLNKDAFLSKQATSWAHYNSDRPTIVHYDAERRGPLERLKHAGFQKRLVSENIAVMPAQATEADILASWKGKKEEENLLNPLYRNVGFGLAPFKQGCVFVVLLTE